MIDNNTNLVVSMSIFSIWNKNGKVRVSMVSKFGLYDFAKPTDPNQD